ncbi:Putative teichuronic acid biosynthesis glycosyltransferase TuaG [Vibrio alginolyticus]|uniref:Putative teichuronic acid biosynthesis glycosyltransferase TuaG n=1 Tax=Vibrio alginolyticus TaxID=663 RepID=A0A1W6UGS3_VIBAL|nr:MULTISPECIES: glycosyltransferase [Vibrio harveyi group]ARO97216.1 Putative teichuronic acid biosynthesis glycosyltransferase TuaG [Vibrio alginolyticus]ARP01943.1 Putative teichuronic acid biosynthesis glycosyltransferase TuaG [Vibrio alginolyticus]ARP06976.1 Putative teichuronic acid biosynthesis glycosyltransferase TuaG [Vibrio alginolyticus]ARP12062.1 Putative teichuronic acid biosynthesis glycosyltransferase TuaG [Vibrio alginolyticus]ARP17115.1 Putative teichuronic acid biosynthesis g
MNQKHLISIITASYNCEGFIKKTYDSIASQTYKHWEWIVTDDCSSDSTLECLREISLNDSRVKVFLNDVNSGAAVSRNNSISKSQGDYLAFIDSDDVWYTEKLEQQLSIMDSNDLEFSFTAYELIDESGKSLNKRIDFEQCEAIGYKDMLKKKATVGCSTVMLRKNAFNDLSMPLIRTGQDYALWLKLLKLGAKAYPINKVLMQYRIVPGSISRNKFKKAKRQWEIYRKIERLSLFNAVICFSFYAWRAVFRK